MDLADKILHHKMKSKMYNEKNKGYFVNYYQEKRDELKMKNLNNYYKNRKEVHCEVCDCKIVNMNIHILSDKHQKRLN